jgi:hypothetical protein
VGHRDLVTSDEIRRILLPAAASGLQLPLSSIVVAPLRDSRPSSANVSYTEPATEEDEDDEQYEAAEPMRESNRWRNARRGSRTGENEYNTPQWLVDAVRSFFPLLDLDPCSNPDSVVGARASFGRQRTGEFINSLILPAWRAPTPTEAHLPPTQWTGKARTVYMNPPSIILEAQQAEGAPGGRGLINAFADKLKQELDAGRVDEALVLVPLDPRKQWWGTLKNGVVCMLHNEIQFVRSAAALERWRAARPGEDMPEPTNHDVIPRAFIYLRGRDCPTDVARRHSDFSRIFGPLGYIPGFNMTPFCG